MAWRDAGKLRPGLQGEKSCGKLKIELDNPNVIGYHVSMRKRKEIQMKSRFLVRMSEGNLGICLGVVVGVNQNGYIRFRRYSPCSGKFGRAVTTNPLRIINTIREIQHGERLPVRY